MYHAKELELANITHTLNPDADDLKQELLPFGQDFWRRRLHSLTASSEYYDKTSRVKTREAHHIGSVTASPWLAYSYGAHARTTDT